jgi:hypothetical protein
MAEETVFACNDAAFSGISVLRFYIKGIDTKIQKKIVVMFGMLLSRRIIVPDFGTSFCAGYHGIAAVATDDTVEKATASIPTLLEPADPPYQWPSCRPLPVA